MTDDIRLSFLLDKLVERYPIFIVVSILVGLLLAYLTFSESQHRYVSRMEVQSERFRGEIDLLVDPMELADKVPEAVRALLHGQIEQTPSRPGINVLLRRDLPAVDVVLENDKRTIRLSSTALESEQLFYEDFHLKLVERILIYATDSWRTEAKLLWSAAIEGIELQEKIEGELKNLSMYKTRRESLIGRLNFLNTFIERWEADQKQFREKFGLLDDTSMISTERDPQPSLSYLVYLIASQQADSSRDRQMEVLDRVLALDRKIREREELLLTLQTKKKILKGVTTLSFDELENLIPIRVVGPIAQQGEKINRVIWPQIVGISVLAIMSGSLAIYIVEGISTTRRRRRKDINVVE